MSIDKAKQFAAHGSQEFNDWMESVTAELVADVEKELDGNLVSLILSGGYARGEGGVVTKEGKEHPYNDLDFVIIVREKVSTLQSKLSAISHKYEVILGIDIDFSRPLTLQDVANWPHWLMWTDLMTGSRVLFGDEDILDKTAPKELRQCPPLIEATRLMLNRGAGLLWSVRVLRGLEPPSDPDFVRRNLHKAVLAMGDAVIIQHGRHQAAYVGRDAILAELPGSGGLIEPYRQALSFRLTPDKAPQGPSNEEELAPIINLWIEKWLQIEEVRTGLSFPSPDSYAAWKGWREPSQNVPSKWPRNIVRNLQQVRLSISYPREELFRTLPLLLAHREGDPKKWSDDSSDLLRVWRCFN